MGSEKGHVTWVMNCTGVGLAESCPALPVFASASELPQTPNAVRSDYMLLRLAGEKQARRKMIFEQHTRTWARLLVSTSSGYKAGHSLSCGHFHIMFDKKRQTV